MKQSPVSYIHHLMALPATSKVRLYSYQHQEAWDRAARQGYWSGDAASLWSHGDDGWGPAFDWMRERMAERVPEFSGDYPMWGWIKRLTAKPGPRKYRGTKGEIRLTVEVPRSRIVFSNYHSWHCVLNRSLDCSTEAEWDQHAEDFPWHWSMPFGDDDEYKNAYKDRYMASIIPSWNRCLSFEPTTDPKVIEWTSAKNRFIVQACVDRFRWEEIIAVRRFPLT